MSDSVEAGKRAAALQARSIAYLEKHRIYELFHSIAWLCKPTDLSVQELATQLVIQKPENHLAFMKQCLQHAAVKRDAPRVLLLAPPNFDRHGLAKAFQEESGIYCVTLKELRNINPKDDNSCRCEESEELACNMKKLLESGVIDESGWLLVDLPRTKKEARAFQRIGIIPTHVIQIIPPTESETSKNEYENVDFQSCPLRSKKTSKTPEEREYVKNLRGLREAYANFLVEIEVGIRSVEELGRDLARLTKTKKHYGAPSLFRIILIGCRGSGCSTMAKYLSERFNLVHVDFDYVMEQTRLQQNRLGEMLRLFECRWGERPKPEMRIQIVEKYISTYDCLRKGWVLTGYPKTVEDFKLLDMTSTPPNKVIFVEVNGDVCRERLLNRRYNVVTGSKHDISSRKLEEDCKLAVHPRDYRMIVERDLQEYEENILDMMEYAGESAFRVDGNDEERLVRERIECCLIRPAPSSKPRVPKPPTVIDPKDIEFDPDDEVDPKVYEHLLAPEPKFTFF